MNEIVNAYLKIFRLVPETCNISKVHLNGIGKNETGENVYNFLAVIESPIDFKDLVVSHNICSKFMKTLLRRDKNIGGPDINCSIKWEIKKKDKIKKKKFIFTTHLCPENIVEFEIVNGILRILVAKCQGVFY